MRRVAVSGIGVISPLGCGLAEAFETARAGRSGIHRLEVRKGGHETYSGLVRIRPGVTTTLNVALAADAK